MFNYESGIDRLVDRVRGMDGDWCPTPLFREINQIAADLERLVDVLELDGLAQSCIESKHDKGPPVEVDCNGMPVPAPASGDSYQVTVMRMRNLAAHARSAAKALPSARIKVALPFAAMALLHLRYQHDYPKPALSDRSADALELTRVCNLAGLPKAPETIRNALSAALKTFDPRYFPAGIYEVVFGG